MEINRGWRYLTLLSLLVVLPAARAAAQGSRPAAGEVEGVVRDSAGKPVANVAVLLQEEGRPTPAETETNPYGVFVFSEVPAGIYTVRLSKLGFRNATLDSLQLAPGEKKHCDLVLRAAQADSPLSSTLESSPSAIELDDRTTFTVSGLTDSTGSGGHGSETRLRTGELLAKETLNLESHTQKGPNAPASSAASTNPRTSESELRADREHVAATLKSEKELSRQVQAELHRSLGDLDERLEEPLSAEREYERAAALDPSEQNYFAWGAELLLHRAAAPALVVFTSGVRLHPHSPRMLAGLGAALYTSGSADDAAHRLCEAADLDPANFAPYLFLGKMQESVSAPLPCAEQKLARFAQDQPANALANYFYGLALWKANRGSENAYALQRAEVLLKKSSEIDPTLDAAYLQLGNLKVSRGDLRNAISAYQRAIALNPQASEAHYRLGLAYKRIGEEANAQSEFERYKQLEKGEAAAAERQRRALRQFLFVLKGSISNSVSK
jgi:Flp pilus assembly protein TadD